MAAMASLNVAMPLPVKLSSKSSSGNKVHRVVVTKAAPTKAVVTASLKDVSTKFAAAAVAVAIAVAAPMVAPEEAFARDVAGRLLIKTTRPTLTSSSSACPYDQSHLR